MPTRRNTLATVSLALLFAARAATAQQSDGDRIADLEGQVEGLTSAYQDLLGITQELRALLETHGITATQGGDDFYIPRQIPDAPADRGLAELGGIYSKPFLSDTGDNVHIGGYIDLEFMDPAGGAGREFDQHRLVPFLYADVSESIKVATEIEVEHGHELEVEFAQMDLLLGEHANVRAGIQLLPLGKLNEVHDSPIQDLTNRPLVDKYIIPTRTR
jgi:hypothetical protein